MNHPSPAATYRAEKERATRERTGAHTKLMADAQEAFDAMLEAGRAMRKRGRPKGSTPTTAAAPRQKKRGRKR